MWSQKWNTFLMHSEQVKFVNHKYDIWNCRSWPEIKYLGRSGLKLAMCLIFIKFSTQNKSKMLIMNILIGTDDLDLKLKICEIWCRNWYAFQFLWNLTLRANRTSKLWILYLELIILTQNYRFGQIWFQNCNVRSLYEFWYSELIE